MRKKSTPFRKKSTPVSNASEDALFTQALALHQSGQLESAGALYQQIIAAVPHHAHALHFLGMLHGQRGDAGQAVDFMSRAIALDASQAVFFSNRANALQNLERYDEALQDCQRAIELDASLLDAYYNRAVVLRKLQRFDEALADYAQVAQRNPQHFNACYQRANVLYNLARYEEAVVDYQRAIAINSQHVEAYYQCGMSLMRLKRYDEAVAAYLQVIALNPQHAPALFNLANTLYQLKRHDEAIGYYDQLLQQQPDNAVAYCNRGATLYALKRYEAAISDYQHTLQFTPDDVDTLLNYALLLQQLERYDEAQIYYQRLLAIDAKHIKGQGSFATLFHAKRQYEQAMPHHDIALSLQTDDPVLWLNRSVTLQNLKRYEEALADCDCSLALNANNPSAYCNRANILRKLNRNQEALDAYNQALAVKPEHLLALTNRSVLYKDQGLLTESLADLRAVLAIEPSNFDAHSKLLFTLNYSAEHDVDFCVAEALRYGEMVSAEAKQPFQYWRGFAPTYPSPSGGGQGGGKRLRIGFVSGDLGDHPVGNFLEDILRHLDSARCELFAYISYERGDYVSKRLRGYFSAWQSVAGLSDAVTAQLIHDDGIQVLVDLAGHTGYNRLPMFGWRPAPVQVAWLGYFATTGVREIDYILLDKHSVPPNKQGRFVEKVCYLPDTRLCFSAPNLDIAVSELPALKNGYLTFGCFQNMSKINDAVLTVWAQIFQALPTARLRIQSKQLKDPALIDYWRTRLQAHQIDLSRVELYPSTSYENYLAAYQLVDIALDTFPFTGGTTTCEALWMGVPTLTLQGDTLLTRQGVSLLTVAGLPDWIANNEADYVAKAIDFAGQLDSLAHCRNTLRTQVLASPLFNAPLFATRFLNTLQNLWQTSEHAATCFDNTPLPEKIPDAETYYCQGKMHYTAQRYDAAAQAYQQAIAGQADYADAYFGLANSLYHSTRYAEAIPYYQQLIALQADYIEAYCNLSNVLSILKRYEESLAVCERGLTIQPNHPSLLRNQKAARRELVPEQNAHIENLFQQALAQQAAGELATAESLYQQVLTLSPQHFSALCHCGNLLQQLQRHEDALACYERAAQLEPQNSSVLTHCSLALQVLNRPEQALERSEQAIALPQPSADDYCQYANLLAQSGRYGEALDYYQQVLAIKPDYPLVYRNRGSFYMMQGLQLNRAKADFEKALALEPKNFDSYSKLLFMLNYQNIPPLPDAAIEFGKQVTAAARWVFSDWSCQSDVLRIGFVSGDFGDHPVGNFLQAVLEHLRNKPCELFAYVSHERDDAVTAQLKTAFKTWRVISTLNDEQSARLIQQDGIHVLCDLAGHSAHNRLPLFAYRPAPVQITWLGYFATTGVREIDYILSDAYSIADEQQFVEKVWLLPNTRLCFTPPRDEIRIGELPAKRNGYLTFGCFQNGCKINDAVLAVWKNILTALPTARLHLQNKQLKNPEFFAQWQQRLQDYGFDLSRVRLQALQHYQAYLAAYNEVDIVLDTFPFPGGTTTCEALWMGVPTLTLQGESLLARQGASLLNTAGLSNWIADNDSDYVAKAIYFAGQLETLSQLRRELRAQVLASPLFDAPLFAENLFNALSAMWQQKNSNANIDAQLAAADALYQSGDYKAALAIYQQVLARQPNHADANFLTANALYHLGCYEDALPYYAQAISLKPDYIEAYCNRANALSELKRYQEALLDCEQALTIAPDHASLHYNRGNILRDLNRFEEAIESYQAAVRCNPTHVKARYKHIETLYKLKRYEQALLMCQQLLAIDDSVESQRNYGVLLYHLERFEQALHHYDISLSLDANDAEAHWNKAVCQLLLGDYAQGWLNYEWRWQLTAERKNQRDFSQPLWLGKTSIVGKTILLHAEQGLGDTVQFCRYAQTVADCGATVILEVQPELKNLLTGLAGVQQLVVRGQPLPDFDLHCPLLSLPLALGTEAHSIPAPIPYLYSSADKLTHWQAVLGEKNRPRIGLVCSGSATHKKDDSRSIALSKFSTLLSARLDCFLLQKELRDTDQDALAQHAKLRFFGKQLLDFSDTAALIELMDVVISVDTAVAHVAAAMGKPVWLIVSRVPDWRWLLSRTDSPWYPTVRLFRQAVDDDWSSVIAEIDSALIAQFALQNSQLLHQAFKLHQAGQLERAAELYQQLLAAHPDDVETLQLLGMLEGQRHHESRAVELMSKAIALDSTNATIFSNRANALEILHRYDEALADCNRAIALDPTLAVAYTNRAVVLQHFKAIDEALQNYAQALRLEPNNATAHKNTGMCHLLQGDFKRGWQEYQWRWQTDEFLALTRHFQQPLWLGEESLTGKRILLHGEQGLGDSIQFCRYAKLVAERGATVLLEVPDALKALLTHVAGVSQLVVRGQPLPDFDYHCPLMSLPLAFETCLDTIPADVPYLFVLPDKVKHWQEKLGNKTLPRIGLVWSGNPAQKSDYYRSIALQEFSELLAIDSIQFFSLQKDVRDSDKAILQQYPNLQFFGEQLEDFTDTAALIAQMDIVISICTSVAHLAGALGKPTWLLLANNACWRWLLNRDDSPWYPTMRLFRQTQRDDWQSVIKNVESALSAEFLTQIDTLSNDAQALQIQALSARRRNNIALSLELIDKAIASEPNNPSFFLDKANTLLALHRHEDALHSYDRALQLKPDWAEVHCNRGAVLHELKRYELALLSYQNALRLKADYVAAYCNAGTTLQALERFEQALSHYDRALKLAPNHAQTHNNRGNVLQKLGRYQDALFSYDYAIALKADYVEAIYNRGNVLYKLERYDEALLSYERALVFKSDYLDALCNRANTLCQLNRHHEAAQDYQRVLAMQPDNIEFNWNNAVCQLRLGHFAEGWQSYEWRWQTELLRDKQRHFQQPLWLGQESLVGKTILLHDEQGVGDTLQFCRYAKLVKLRGAKVLLQVPQNLKALLKNLAGVELILSEGEKLPDFDFHCPLMSLPFAFHTRLENIPAEIPYLLSNPHKVQQWQARLGKKTLPRLGLVWSGSSSHPNDKQRSIALANLLPLLSEHWQVFSLQKEVRDSDAAVLKQHPEIQHYGKRLSDFSETAALIELMDIVISVDTAVAHLAAAMAKPTWILLPYHADWRWLLERNDSPWYSTVRLFRQTTRDDWQAVIENIQQTLLVQFSVSTSVDSYFQQGNAQHNAQDYTAALLEYNRILVLNPRHAATLCNRGNTLQVLERYEEALDSYNSALAIEANNPIFLNNRANLLRQLERYELALLDCDKAITLNPNLAAVHYNRSLILKDLNLYTEALQNCDHALVLTADDAKLHNHRGILLQNLGLLVEAETSFRQALSLKPSYFAAYSNLLFALNYDNTHSPDFCLAQARRCGEMIAQNIEPFTNWQCQKQTARLRVGFVSGDLGCHPVGFFFQSLIKHIDLQHFELFAYLPHEFSDEIAKQMKSHFSGWQSLHGLNAQAAAQRVHDDGIHILFDLSGHTGYNQLMPLFAYKPAPVQVAWLGYFATTGIAAIDYILVDEVGVPTENQNHFSEKIWYLPTRLCFTPPTIEIAVAPLPALHNGYLTFGCFQNRSKINDAVLIVWANLLKALPTARLRLQCKQFQDTPIMIDLSQQLQQHGVDLTRVDFVRPARRADYLADYNEVDIALDTFPYTGGTTTCEALWMGVPTLTLLGETLIARQGASLLSAAELTDWIAVDTEDYVNKAVAWESKIDELARLRANLRAHVSTTALFDAPRFAKQFEFALQGMWQSKQNTPPSLETAALLQQALALHQAGQLNQAELLYQQLLAENPYHAEVLNFFGILEGQRENPVVSVDLLNQAIALQPNNATFLANRGYSLQKLKRYDESLRDCDRAIALAPNFVDAHFNRSVTLKKLNRLDDALQSYEHTLALTPRRLDVLNNYANLLCTLDRHDDALRHFDIALSIDPNNVEAYCNRGVVLDDMQRHREALSSYEQALARDINCVDANWNKAINRLRAGDFAQGWQSYEWRWQTGFQDDEKRDFAQPLWLGKESLHSKTILLHSEQGLGDTLQFCRYAKAVADLGATVLLAVQPALQDLLADLAGVHRLMKDGEVAYFHYHCPLMSLPLAFNTRLESIPFSHQSYLFSQPAKVQAWQEKLGEKTRPRVGLVWAGNTKHKNDRHRSLAFSELVSVLSADFEFICLQKELRDGDAAQLTAHNITYYGEQLGDFTDTAALIELMDVVICVDTSVAHLAAAMAKPTWLLLPYNPDWRWLLNRENSPWYSSARLFRQTQPNEWQPVIAQVRKALSTAFIDSRTVLEQALELHQAGQLDQAEVFYQQLISQNPNHADALHFLGMLHGQRGNAETAVELISKAIAHHSQSALFFSNRANALIELGRYDAALADCQQAIRLSVHFTEGYYNQGIALNKLNRHDEALQSFESVLKQQPNHTKAHNNHGNTLLALKRDEEALASYQRALDCEPNYAEAHCNRGVALGKLKRYDEALACYDRALALKDDYPEAHCNRGAVLCDLKRDNEALDSYARAIALKPDYLQAYCNQAVTLQTLKRYDEALNNYALVLKIDPDYIEAYCGQGSVLHDMQRYDEAESCYQQALRLDAHHAHTHFNYANLYFERQQFEQALTHYEQAIASQADYASAYCNRGNTLSSLGRYDEALSSYQKASELQPDFANVQWNEGFCRLLLGDFEQGWQKYEARWQIDEICKPRDFTQPRWSGENLQGKAILLHAEQGLGDTVQFCRYVPLLADLGAKIFLEAPSALKGLLSTLRGLSGFIDRNQPLDGIDYHCPLLSLPLVFNTRLESIPATVPYLFSDADKRQHWQNCLSDKTRPRIGVVWSGNPAHKNDHNRSLPLAELLNLISANWQLVSLQKQLRDSDLSLLNQQPVLHYGEQLGDFTDTAALIDLMDVVLSVDTSVAHVAAAMGKPTWLLLPYNPDWRWLLQREDCPWYSTARLFRQAHYGDWQDVLVRVKNELNKQFS